jgi:hypothetical protein
MKPSRLPDLNMLPGGLVSYTGMEFSPEMYKAFQSLGQLITSGKSEDKNQAKALQEALAEFEAAQPKTMLAASMLEVGRGGLQVWRYGNPDRGIAAHLKYFQAMKEGAVYQFVPVKGDPEIKMNAETYRDGKLHSVQLKWDLAKLSMAFPNAGDGPAEAFRRLTGEGIRLWFGNVDKQTVQVWAKDWKTARKYLDQYFARQKLIGAKRNKGFALARANLAREVTYMNLTDMPLFAQFYGDFLYDVMKSFTKLPEKPPAPAKKNVGSFLGLSLTLKPCEGRFDLWVPAKATGDIRRIVEMLTPKEEGE